MSNGKMIYFQAMTIFDYHNIYLIFEEKQVISFLIMSIEYIDIGGSGHNMMLSGLSRSVPR